MSPPQPCISPITCAPKSRPRTLSLLIPDPLLWPHWPPCDCDLSKCRAVAANGCNGLRSTGPLANSTLVLHGQRSGGPQRSGPSMRALEFTGNPKGYTRPLTRRQSPKGFWQDPSSRWIGSASVRRLATISPPRWLRRSAVRSSMGVLGVGEEPSRGRYASPSQSSQPPPYT